MTTVEAAAALALLAVIIAAIVPVLSRTSQLRLKVEQRETALNAVANLLERTALLQSINEAALQSQAVDLVSPGDLPSPEWKFTVADESPVRLKRVEATLSWQPSSSPRSSVSLVRWFAEGQL